MTKDVWASMNREAKRVSNEEPSLVSLLNETILNQPSFANALAFHLAGKFEDSTMTAMAYNHLFLNLFESDSSLEETALFDLYVIKERDPACDCYLVPFLYFKGFVAIQAARLAHLLWLQGRRVMALHLQSRSSEIFATDIHPAARIGRGIMLDHGTSFVVGETAVIGENVSILHEVTLGGSGKESGDRHPKVGDGVLIGAGAKLLGNIKIGNGAKVGAGSVVLEDVEAHVTVAGIPAKAVGKPSHRIPAKFMDHSVSNYSI